MSDPERANITDQRHYEPQSKEEIEREFAGWHAWRGVSRLWYARRLRTSPPWTVGPAEDLLDLRDRIIVCIRQHER